jgi:hypothetical protein
MLDEGVAWLSWDTVARHLLLFVAGYVAATAATLLVLVAVLAGLPTTYFRDDTIVQPLRRGGAAAIAIRLVKNAVGIVLIGLGLLLSLPAVPGQGVLTLLVGLLLVDFPGKRRLERKLVSRPGVLEAMNRLRTALGRPPLVR